MSNYQNYKNQNINKIFKYLIQAIIVGLTAKWISSHKLTNQEIIIISLVSAGTFILLDLYSPTISNECLENIKNKLND